MGSSAKWNRFIEQGNGKCHTCKGKGELWWGFCTCMRGVCDHCSGEGVRWDGFNCNYCANNYPRWGERDNSDLFEENADAA